jgi:hypothetical protein
VAKTEDPMVVVEGKDINPSFNNVNEQLSQLLR